MILTIDPGIHTGIALWKNWEDLFPKTYEIFAGEKGTHEEKLYTLQAKFTQLVDNIEEQMIVSPVDDSNLHIFIEGVEHWAGNLKSQTASTRGNLSFLSYMVGVYCAVCFAKDFPVKIIPARVWKGQMSKSVTATRVFKINEVKYKSSHVIDAVGMGFAMQGIL